MDQVITELQECLQGRRGWVQVSKARIRRAHGNHAVIVAVAERNGMIIDRHGKYGYCAFLTPFARELPYPRRWT